jgi:CubicO group peptidase (beta-lactamase class C family)
MPEKNLDFLDEAQRTGFFTHCYLEAGFLSGEHPEYRLVRAQDESRSVYDLASLTKALVTAPLAYQLLTCQASSLVNPRLADWLMPNETNKLSDTLASIKVWDLLSHRSGLPAWLNFWVERLHPGVNYPEVLASAHDHIKAVMDRHNWINLSRGQERYSDVGFILLGIALEAHYQKNLAACWQDELLRPAGINMPPSETIGFPTAENRSRQKYITSAYCPIREKWLRGEVHDENAAALGGVAGHAGLFASGPKLGRYLREFYQSSIGQDFFHDADRRRQSAEALPGLRLGDDSASSVFAGGESLGHWGFTGTGFWLHIPSGRYAIVLTNRVISGRRSAKTQAFRRAALSHLDTILTRKSTV